MIPLSGVKHLPIMELVKLTRTCLIEAIKKNCLEHVAADFIEELDEEDLVIIKPQLDRVTGLTRAIIDKRVRWNAWPTGPVVPLDVTKASLEQLNLLSAQIQRELYSRSLDYNDVE